MSQNLATQSTTGRRKPNLQTPDQHRFLSSYTSAVEETPGGANEISHLAAPTPNMRAALSDRLRQVREGMAAEMLSRDNLGTLLAMILELFDAYPTVKMDAEKAQGVAKTFAAHVEHLPHWAVREGIFEIQGRKTPFPPSPGELKEACERKLAPLQEEAAQIRKVLDASVYQQNSEDERARIKQGFADLLAELRGKNGTRSDKPRRAADYRDNPDTKAQATLDAMDRNAPLPKLSDEALGRAARA